MKTVLHPKNDTDVYLDLTHEVFDSIRHIRDSYNGRVTTGVVVYELLLMNGEYVGRYRDWIDEFEKRIDTELQETLRDNNKRLDGDFTQITRRIDAESWMSGQLRDNNSWGETARSLKISLPEQLTDGLTFQRGWSDRLRDCLTDWIESPFASRLYRIESKQALIRYVKTDSVPEDDVAKAIISQDTSEFRNLPRIDDTTIESEAEYRARADELDDWQKERYPALDNFAEQMTREAAIELFEEEHGVDTDWYVEKKVEAFADEYDHPHLLDEGDDSEDDDIETVLDTMTNKEQANLSPATVQNWSDEADTVKGRLELVSQALINELNRGNEVTEADAELCLEYVDLDTEKYGVSDLPRVMLVGDKIEQF
jgi:hypothetical protein